MLQDIEVLIWGFSIFSLLMGARSEWTRPVNHQKTDLEDTEGVQLEAEAFSVEAEVGAVVFLGVSQYC